MSLVRSIVIGLLLTAAGALPAVAGNAADRHLSIATASGSHEFTIEVMRTRSELERGLMYRREMPKNAGMLFDFGEPQPVMMWMKNTYLPLDMLFIAGDGHVVSIKQNATPMSEDTISSGEPVTGVLEVNAGTVARIGVKTGDVVRHPMFKPQ